MVNMHCFIGYSLMMKLSRKLESIWYSNEPPNILLKLLALCFKLVSVIRQQLYKLQILKQIKVKVPVIVVGNITTGGTGKTPVTVWLVEIFQKAGMTVGVISRGYGGTLPRKRPALVTKSNDAVEYGDEPVYIAKKTDTLVCVCTDKVKAAKTLISKGAEVIISDDGLQHYHLARDFEILIIDSVRGFGNGYLLPAGPLRENPKRAQMTDWILLNGDGNNFDESLSKDIQCNRFKLLNATAVNHSGTVKKLISDFSGSEVYLLAGISNPERLLKILEDNDISVIQIEIDDHGKVDLSAIREDTNTPILMTPKDAVKYDLGLHQNCWIMEPEVEFDDSYRLPEFIQTLVRNNHEPV